MRSMIHVRRMLITEISPYDAEGMVGFDYGAQEIRTLISMLSGLLGRLYSLMLHVKNVTAAVNSL